MSQLGSVPPGLPTPPRSETGLVSWASTMVMSLGNILARVFQDLGQQPRAPEFTVATIPLPGMWKGRIIFVSDAAPGARFQGSTGSAWVNLG